MTFRCFGSGDELYAYYHDNIWGKPVYDDTILFEYLILEGAQAGLSWITILRRQKEYNKAFDNFDYYKISKYDEDKVNELMLNTGIIRNKRKILATIKNAKSFIEVREEFGSFSNYLWEFVNHTPIINHHKKSEDIPVYDELAKKVSDDLVKRGFSFVGPTIIYSYLQAVGVINDHLDQCKFKY